MDYNELCFVCSARRASTKDAPANCWLPFLPGMGVQLASVLAHILLEGGVALFMQAGSQYTLSSGAL